METKRNHQLLLILILCSLIFSQTAACIPLEDPSAAGNARHADAVFTNDYSSLLGQISSKKYLAALIGKWAGDVLEDVGPVKRQSDMVFTDRYVRLRKEQKKRKYLQSLLEKASSGAVPSPRRGNEPGEESKRK